jgi:phospholipase C
MDVRIRIVIVILAIGMAAAAIALIGIVLPRPPLDTEVAGTTPIRHVFVIMKENHAFDNYFGTFPGADEIPPGVRVPDGSGGTIAPYWIASTSTYDLPHSRVAMLEAWNNGSNDRFAVVAARWGPGRGPASMGHYDARQLPFYWALAQNFTLADRYFQPMFGPTIPNRLFSFAATNAGLESNMILFSNLDGLTIFDQLEARRISWRYYHEPSSIHAPLPAYFKTLASNRAMLDRLVPLNRLLADLQTGDVAQVTYVDPSDSSTISEHPAQNVSLGETWTKNLIHLIMSSVVWGTTAIFLTWDESGGYYDHVPPPQVDPFGEGFRVPMIVVSLYAKRGFIDHDTLDHTSIIKFIASNWGLPYLTSREEHAGNFMGAFSFDTATYSLWLSPLHSAISSSSRAAVCWAQGLEMLQVASTIVVKGSAARAVR